MFDLGSVGCLFRRSRRSVLCLIFGLTFTPLVAHAVDGVIEIDHVTAIAGNITAGDTSGYPITISSRGSYRLTGDLLPAPPLHCSAIGAWSSAGIRRMSSAENN